MLLPPSQAAVAEAVSREAGGLASLLQQQLPPDADPSAVLVQLQQLRALLQQEEKKRDTVAEELGQLQQQLQQAVYEQELMREQRGAPEPPTDGAARGAPGVSLIDEPTYSSMLPEEQVELNLFGFRISYAVTSKPGEQEAAS